MASCENDLHRAKLAENIWEEGGAQAPSERHAEIFRRFLRDGLSVDDRNIEFLDGTRFFVREFLDFCREAHPAAASAFLSLGTEGIVPRMYAVFLDGLRKAGVVEEHLAFFRIHMECDDAHAETLEHIMASYATMPDWLAVCQQAMDYALNLRARFFEHLFEAVEARRVRKILGHIQRAAALAPEEPEPSAILHRRGSASLPLYGNVSDRLNIDFSVERVPFAADVFDARVLRIAPHKNNERHKHPHESIFYVISGKGKVTVNRTTVDVEPGDLVFVPRWSLHQSVSTSDEDLVILAITDFGLTEAAYIGDHLRTTRLKGAQVPRPKA
jgi:quercetin dioxygenase-like cupin family protein/pyrroloquinoline quinone (PQQ) biosynthesis protein C